MYDQLCEEFIPVFEEHVMGAYMYEVLIRSSPRLREGRSNRDIMLFM